MKRGNVILAVLVTLLVAVGAFEVYIFATYRMELVNGLIGLFLPDSAGAAPSAPQESSEPLESEEIVIENTPEQIQDETEEENNQYVQNGEYVNYPGIPAFPSAIISADVNQNSGEWTYNHDSSNRDADIAEYESIMEEHGYTEGTMGDGALTFTKDGNELGVVVLLTFDDIVVSIWAT